MKKFIISVGSVTYALKAKDILLDNGYNAKTVRRQKDIGKFGCGYAVTVTAKLLEDIVAILKNAGIKILNIETVSAS